MFDRNNLSQFLAMEPNELDALAVHLNLVVDTFLPDGAPALTLSKLQAETLRDLVGPMWMTNAVGLERLQLIRHPTIEDMQALKQLKNERSRIEFVLACVVMNRPNVERAAFIVKTPDGEVFNAPLAVRYLAVMEGQWANIPVITEGKAN